MAVPTSIDPRLKEFAIGARQTELIDACIEHGCVARACKALGMAPTTAWRSLKAIKARAAQQGYAAEHQWLRPVPEPHVAAGVSTLYDSDGNVRAQWVKSRLKAEEPLEALKEAIQELKGSIPKAKPQQAPKASDADLLNLYVITDYHLGAYAWAEECGEPWDSDIAENLLVQWFQAAIERSPRSEVGVLAQLGDLLHYDGLGAVTPTAGHLLDADTRFQRVVRVVIRVLRRVIGMLLARHQRVHIIMAEGNHDLASSAWLREVLAAFYLSEPRIVVDVSPDPYYCVEHGSTALFFHHGHMKKQAEVDRVFAAKFREQFGRTKHAFAHMGHYHHRREIESALMVVRQHRTLAAADAYASRGGYVSGREAQVITYHREHGEVQTLTISPQAVA